MPFIFKIIVLAVPIFFTSLTQAQNGDESGTSGTAPPQTTEHEYYYDDYVTDEPPPLVDIEEEIRMCENATCVRKCCLEGKYFSLHEEFGCIAPKEGDPEFELKFQHKDGRPADPEKPVHLLYGHQFQNCTVYGPIPEHRKAVLLSDGRLYTAHDDIFRNTSSYCLDVIRRGEKHFSMWPVVCFEEYQETPRTLFRYYGHAICLILSSVSLLVIIVCHVTLPRLRDLSGLCLLSHVTSLFVADVSLVTVTLASEISKGLCVFLGIVIHSSFIATYMWLTVMCFDIWRYVRMSVKGIPSHLLQQQERRLFACYSAVVWGAILVITCTTCTLHFLPQEALPDYVIRPHFGVNRCFIIEEDANLLAYFFSILAVLCLLNVGFVGKTIHYLYEGGARICCFQKKSTTSGESVVFNNKHLDLFWQRFQIFSMTIVVWTTEVLSWKIPPKELWDATDLLNTCQGVILLVIFLRSKRKREIIETRARSVMGKAQTAARKFVSQEETTLSTLETNLSKLNSDKETVDKIRKLSKQEETATSTIMKSLVQHKIEVEPQDAKETSLKK